LAPCSWTPSGYIPPLTSRSNQDLHPYRTTGKIIVMYILISVF
jgi:hypothetical protein